MNGARLYFSDIELIDEHGVLLDPQKSPAKQILQVFESGIENQDPKQLLNTFFFERKRISWSDDACRHESLSSVWIVRSPLFYNFKILICRYGYS